MLNKEQMHFNAIFKYNNKKYYLFMTEKCKKYILKEVDGKLDYIDAEEYKNIMKDVFLSKSVLYNNEIFSIAPLIKYKNKLVSFALIGSIILSLNGCSSASEKTQDGLSKIGIQTEAVSDLDDFYFVSSISKDGDNMYKGFDFSEFRDVAFDNLCTPSTFGDYVGIKNVSFEDLRTVTKENKNIDEKLQKIIIDGIDNLEKDNFNIDYSVLYYNLSRLTVEYVPESIIGGNAGRFYNITSTAFISDSLNENDAFSKKVILHEILGHGSTTAYNEEKKVWCRCADLYLNIDDSGNIMECNLFGDFGEEAIADIIASKSLGHPLNVDEWGYSSFVYGLTLFCESLDISIEDYTNNGINIIIDKMKEKGISNPYLIIMELDSISSLICSGSLVQSNSTDLYKDYVDELLKLGIDKQKVYESTESFEQYVKPLYSEGEFMLGSGNPDSYDIVMPTSVTEYVNQKSK